MLAAMVLGVPGLAGACPACARDGSSSTVAWLIGGMILAPMLLSGVVFYTAKRLQREDAEPLP